MKSRKPWPQTQSLNNPLPLFSAEQIFIKKFDNENQYKLNTEE